MQGVPPLCHEHPSIPVLVVNKLSSQVHSKTAAVKVGVDKLGCLAFVFSLSG